MPELPEVEVVRRGLAEHLVDRRIASAQFHGSRVARRHVAGPSDLADRIEGSLVADVRRRGKYLWLVLEGRGGPAEALLVHLGMSGQLLVEERSAPEEKHLHARLTFADEGRELRFVDQRTFGAMALAQLRPDGIPEPIGHIAPDPFEPSWDEAAVVARMSRRESAVKRALLDQTLLSGIGNIYADEALWRARLHGQRVAARLSGPAVGRLLRHARDVMLEALAAGGTSFDPLYVDVLGASGYFDRSLDVYGQEGRPCRRCGAPIRREAFMNRSSYSCPRCQPRPRPGSPGRRAPCG